MKCMFVIYRWDVVGVCWVLCCWYVAMAWTYISSQSPSLVKFTIQQYLAEYVEMWEKFDQNIGLLKLEVMDGTQSRAHSWAKIEGRNPLLTYTESKQLFLLLISRSFMLQRRKGKRSNRSLDTDKEYQQESVSEDRHASKMIVFGITRGKGVDRSIDRYQLLIYLWVRINIYNSICLSVLLLNWPVLHLEWFGIHLLMSSVERR